MMTWFDVLLITLLALITAMGVQRGLAGFLWGIGAALMCLGCNFLPALPALLVALILGGALAYATQQLFIRRGADSPLWERLLGGVGAFAFGLVFIGAFSLGFPHQKGQSYPAKGVMPPALYDAVAHSAVQAEAHEWLARSPLWRRWMTPDQLRGGL